MWQKFIFVGLLPVNFSIVSFTELLIIDGNEYNKPLKIVTSVLNFF